MDHILVEIKSCTQRQRKKSSSSSSIVILFVSQWFTVR